MQLTDYNTTRAGKSCTYLVEDDYDDNNIYKRILPTIEASLWGLIPQAPNMEDLLPVAVFSADLSRLLRTSLSILILPENLSRC